LDGLEEDTQLTATVACDRFFLLVNRYLLDKIPEGQRPSFQEVRTIALHR
jgi:hypothetical protein